MNTLTYKNYTAHIEFDATDQIFIGRISDINDIVTFHADSMADLEDVFHKAVDDYLAACQKCNKTAAKAAFGAWKNKMIKSSKFIRTIRDEWD